MNNKLIEPENKSVTFFTLTVFNSTSRNASVHQILGRPGEVWLPESGADKLVVMRE